MGSIRKEGLVFTVPFSIRRTISLRVRNFNSNQLKVNDVKGNPIEIAAVIVYKVVDSAKAVFDVDDYSKFVNIQSEAAIRAVATRYPYDSFEDEEERTLRGNADEISDQLSREVQERLQVAGVEVIEARLTHLAYSTEIAQAMLQRQQATAILAARRHIVNGAVGIVEDAISRLEKEGSVELDEERRAAMINNLLVSIVADNRAQPVINTGWARLSATIETSKLLIIAALLSSSNSTEPSFSNRLIASSTIPTAPLTICLLAANIAVACCRCNIAWAISVE